ncbi:MAG: hypothetical protein A3H97_04795 [Acidobacteria bacterium RIFCSPLOWO2_02_FULL_65_29]|nr:MAG: hypothetical protein A3H97_04795 [Acidobacteria bacterium RIFCSPLOWO2_02_FULL_65_29]
MDRLLSLEDELTELLQRVSSSGHRPLNHPNIAAIYGFEEAGGVKALLLELGSRTIGVFSRPTNVLRSGGGSRGSTVS